MKWSAAFAYRLWPTLKENMFKGVYYFKPGDCWSASYSGKYLGRYATQRDAAIAHDIEARRVSPGRTHVLNFPNDVFPPPVRINRRDRDMNRKYRGAYKRPMGWIAVCNNVYIGSYGTERDAAIAYDNWSRLHGRRVKLNFPNEFLEPAPHSAYQCIGVRMLKPGLWEARYKDFCGYFRHKNEAMHGYDNAARADGVTELNFPDDIKVPTELKIKSKTYHGVMHDSKGWQMRYKSVYSQYYETEEEAARAYDEALGTRVNFPDKQVQLPPTKQNGKRPMRVYALRTLKRPQRIETTDQ